ncbi:MAG TPA: glycosyltransferase family 87 protein [Clostridia bacterium]|nr:glycosyltransferase family 87 protein [Clostridia bacterium]
MKKYFIQVKWANLQRLGRWLLGAFFIFGVFQPLFSLGKILWQGILFDFSLTYMRAAKAILAGKNIYSFGDINYPPPSLFLFLPFSFLPLFWSQLIWSLLSLVCLGTSILISLKILDQKVSLFTWFWITPLVLLSFPVKWTLGMGQMNNLILLLMVLSFFFYKKKKEDWAGVFLGLAISFKIVPFFLVLLFFLKRKLKIVLTSFLTTLALFLLSGLFFGLNLISDYFLKVVPKTFGPAGKEIYYNQAISGFVSRIIFDFSLQSLLTNLLALAIVAFTSFALVRRNKVTDLDYALVITTFVLVSPFSWQHHFVWLLFPFLAALVWLQQRKKTLGWKLLLALAYFLVAINIKQPDLLLGIIFGKILLSHVFLGGLLLWLILVYLKRNEEIFY